MCQSWTRDPTLPMIEGRAFMSSGATVLASRPAMLPSISRAILPWWLTVHCWRALRASACLDKRCFWWGRRIMFPLRMLAAHSETVLIRSLLVPLPAAWQTWAVPWLGCICHPHAYEGCKGSRHTHSDDGSSSPQRWWQWCCCYDPIATAAAALGRVLVADSCCTVPHCNGECMAANEATAMLDGPYVLQWRSLFLWSIPCKHLSFSGLGGRSIGERLEKVFIWE